MAYSERARKLPILIITIRGVLFLSLTATVVNLLVNGYQYDSVFEFLPGLLFGIFLLLYTLARKGMLIIPSLVLVILLSLPAYYLSFRWGTMIPQSWILFALTIVMAGVLLNSTYALLLVIIHGGILVLLTYLQIIGRIKYLPWDQTPMLESALVAVVTFTVIGIISWLSNREIEKALKRARESEMALRRERDMLEINVAEKTRQLQQVWEKERMNMQEFASIGRHTIGVIHDLVTPLTTLSVNLKMLKTNNHSRLITKATQASDQIERYIEMTRQKLNHKDMQTNFSLSGEIAKAKKSLARKSQAVQVKILSSKSTVEIFGNPPSFHQLVLNLLDNAIDSYAGSQSKKREVIVDIKQNTHHVFLTVIDYGRGIATVDRGRIFDPFFTTKGSAGKMGVGLAICKEIVEKDFGGIISVKSKLNQGTTFVIRLPIVKKKT